MKRIGRGISLVIAGCLMTGCGNTGGMEKGINSANSVTKVINDQVNAEEAENVMPAESENVMLEEDKEAESENETVVPEESEETENEGETVVLEEGKKTENESETVVPEEGKETENESETVIAEEKEEAKGDVDYDLTEMSSDMVYATVYQMMVTPEEYEGKTFRMDGIFYASYYEATEKYYYYCIIQDATACCAQGMEFVWGDGSHKYPEEYPQEGDYVIVEGTFETYREEGDERLYCRLADSKLEIK